MLKRVLILLTALALCGGVAACSTGQPGADEGPPPKNTVIIKSRQFTPGSITVKVGETVTWKFEDNGVPHNVVGVGDAKQVLDSDTMATGTYTHTFTKPGTYDYICTLHPDMTGVVIVQP